MDANSPRWQPTVRWAAVRWAAATLLLAACQTVLAEEARQWLDRMAQAARTLSYDGIFIYRRGSELQSLRIVHRFDGSAEQERLLALDGLPREVIRNHDSVTCILPAGAPVIESKRSLRSINTGPLFAAPGVPDTYDIRLNGEGRTAGRRTVRLSVMPRDTLRYGYRLWIDQATALLLRSALIAPQGQVLEEFIYTSVEVPVAISDKALRPTIGGRGFTAYSSRIAPGAQEERRPFDRRPVSHEGSNWRIAWMPRGFQMRERLVGTAPEDGALEHWVFTDGLASVSVFIEQFKRESDRLNGHSALGAVSAFGLSVGVHQVTVVGEVPPQTVERIGQSVAAGH
ncbi:MAG: transcriptional regulator [Gammaproteobacteria bacterium]|nr:transcriptional regulator [Gammaproteobacteria bacterium]